MCRECEFLLDVCLAAKKNPHRNYYPTLLLAGQMALEKRLTLVAGDCPPAEAWEHLEREDHYTVCHYFRCNTCGQYYFIGACIRGTPIFKELDNLESINLDTMLWGRIGTMFA